MPPAYSYLRFSSPQQAAGDSVRRQTAAREAWLAAHPGVQLDQSLVMTDTGRSAFKRDDWDTYALARFVDHIRARRVEPGSYLLVENLDRLSRENAGEATELFLSIVNKGVVVVQLSPIVMEFRRPVNMHSLMFAILELSRGHSESAAKSERVGAAWARKQREAATRVVTRRLPGWVRLADGKLTADPAAAETVRRIFELARDGSGVAAIARTLNAERVPVIGRKTFKGRSVAWSSSTIYQILTSRAVVGEYVPYKCRSAGRKPPGESVPGYFPPVIDPDTFHAVQGVIARRATSGRGRRGKHVNVFAGLLANARDGGSLTYRHHSTRPTTLVPADVKSGRTGNRWVSFPAAAFEDAVLDELAEIKAADVAGDGRAGKKVETLAGKVAELDNLIKLWSAKMDNPATVDAVAAKLADYAGTLGVRPVVQHAHVVHGVENAPVHRLQAVAHVGQSSADDDRHRIAEIRTSHLLFNVDGLNVGRTGAATVAGW